MGIANEDPVIQPPGLSRLILEPDDLQVHSAVRETDARTALTRGLSEYMQGLKITHDSGRETRFARVLETWSEAENEMVFPSAIVYAPDTGTYDASAFATQAIRVADVDGKIVVIRKTAELTQNITVETHATDPVERMAIGAMLEDAFSPAEYMAGFRLELPHYFNARATYLLTSSVYQDSGDGAQRRDRMFVATLEATVSVIRFVGPVPRLDARFNLAGLEGPGS